MTTAKLTVRLSRTTIEFAKRYAQAHRLTLTELIDRHFRHLRGLEYGEIHPEVERMTGLIAPDADAEAEYHEHFVKKHR